MGTDDLTPAARAILPIDHPTATVFLDETGVVDHREDSVFGIGCLKVRDPGPLLRAIEMLRNRVNVREELHWAGFDKGPARSREDLVRFACGAIDAVFDSPDSHFSCSLYRRGAGDLAARFAGHPHPRHKAYELLAAEVLAELTDEQEIITVLADHISTPKEIRFERDTAAIVNASKNRLTVAGICRLDSCATDGLQLVDLLLGAAAFDLRRVAPGDRQKDRILDHLLERCDCATFRPRGHRDPLNQKFDVRIVEPPRRSHRGRR